MKRQFLVLLSLGVAQAFAQNPLLLDPETHPEPNPVFTPNFTYSLDYFKNVSGGLRAGSDAFAVGARSQLSF